MMSWIIARTKESRDAIELMKKNLTFPFCVKDLATTWLQPKTTGTSISKTRSDFTSKVLEGASNQEARWYLLNTNLNITRIAFDCGFSDCAHFTNLFTQIYGESQVDSALFA